MAANILGSAAYGCGIECVPATAVAYPATGTEFTLMGWVYLPTNTSISNYRTFFSLQGATCGFSVGTNSDKQTFTITNMLSADHSGSLLPLTQWFHIAATYTSFTTGSTLFRGYINGKIDIDEMDTQAIDDFNFMPVIGNYQESYPLNGYVSDVRLWTRAMRQDEIIKEMQSDIPVDQHGLYNAFDLEKSLTRDTTGRNFTTVTAIASPVIVRGPVRTRPNSRKNRFT